MAKIDDYVTASEAAAIIGVSKSQVTRYTEKEQLAHEWWGGRLRIKRRDAVKFVRPPRGNPNYVS